MFKFLLITLLVIQVYGKPWDPIPNGPEWLLRHKLLIDQTIIHKTEEQIVFVGDSITDFWTLGQGRDVWAKYYANRHAFNYGISGDRTENVVYRIQNKEFDGLKPKVTVVMIGTNNIPLKESTEDIAKGVEEIVRELLAKMPETKVILLGVLPRGLPLGNICKELNTLIKKLDNQKNVFWLDMWSAFEGTDGDVKHELFNLDKLHPNHEGYVVWQKTMEPLLQKLLQ
ncbi:platelet-activating factor acetylhydrolase IB subunit alpha2-like [Oppia nitens]|uniref:platelet-activating factor acetylhydrolase IB subunit alpha2-like n=1 Tax=Oppia nitens TaxID=1686743 RepID=UPI0023DA07CB|nr:platelet-activating factor acetylhydrolase IB subunit alpha2-like [Oppia nitens]